MEGKELADYLERHNFPEELRLYLERLCNTRDYSPWKALAETGEATVKVSIDANNKVTIEAHESSEAQLSEELEIAKKTITEQAEEIKSLKKEAKEATTTKIIVKPTEQPKKRTVKAKKT